MGQVSLISGIIVVATFFVSSIVLLDDDDRVKPVPLAGPVPQDEAVASTVSPKVVEETRAVEVGSGGSALATAAFGLSALQPETFNGEIVLDIIEASPLEFSEKDRLTAKLMAAKAGNAELPRVLADIRMSLAIE